jgi:hypothetical protein
MTDLKRVECALIITERSRSQDRHEILHAIGRCDFGPVPIPQLDLNDVARTLNAGPSTGKIDSRNACAAGVF